MTRPYSTSPETKSRGSDGLASARKELACQLISTAVDDIALWAKDYVDYREWQRQELRTKSFEETAIYELNYFFCGENGGRSALEALISEFALQLPSESILIHVMPTLIEARVQVDRFRVYAGLPPFFC